MTGNLTEARETVVVIGQIEDQGSLDHLDEIMTVDGIDCFFVGRADLAVALGAASITDSIVLEASERIVEAARRARRRTGMFVSDLKETRRWVDLGVSLFLLESDQSFLLSGAKSLKDRFELACGAPLRGTGPS
jgi:2-keto-3-deoxy-L-rhamnonate aldolase RhmA